MTYRIALAYIHPGHVSGIFLDSVVLMLRESQYEVEIVRQQSGSNVQIARNAVVRFFVNELDSDYLMFVDADMGWDSDVPARLIEKDVPIVSALYLGRQSDGRAFPVGSMWATPDKLGAVDKEGRAVRDLSYTDFSSGELLEVAGVGMGCCVVKREVVEALGPGAADRGTHPHTWPFSIGQHALVTGGMLVMGEDITFCFRAGDLGYKSYIAPDVIARHVKEFVVGPNAITEERKVELGNPEEGGVLNGQMAGDRR